MVNVIVDRKKIKHYHHVYVC